MYSGKAVRTDLRVQRLPSTWEHFRDTTRWNIPRDVSATERDGDQQSQESESQAPNSSNQEVRRSVRRAGRGWSKLEYGEEETPIISSPRANI